MKLRKYLDNFYETVKSIDTLEGTIDTKAVIYRNILLLQFSIIIDKKDISETENIVFLAKYIDDRGVMDLTNYYKELSYLQSIVDRKPSTYFEVSLSEFKELEVKIENLVTILYSKLGTRLSDKKSEFLGLDEIRRMIQSGTDGYRLDSLEEPSKIVINKVELDDVEVSDLGINRQDSVDMTKEVIPEKDIIEKNIIESNEEEITRKETPREEILEKLVDNFSIEVLTEKLADKLNLDSISDKIKEDLSSSLKEDIKTTLETEVTNVVDTAVKSSINDNIKDVIDDKIKDGIDSIERTYEVKSKEQEERLEEERKLMDSIRASLKDTVEVRDLIKSISKEKFNPLESPIANEPEFIEEDEEDVQEDAEEQELGGGINIGLDDMDSELFDSKGFGLLDEVDTQL